MDAAGWRISAIQPLIALYQKIAGFVKGAQRGEAVYP
jgi:hypothetical protein